MVKMNFRRSAELDLDTIPHSLRKTLLSACRDVFDDWAIGKILSEPLIGYRMHRCGVYRIIYEVRESSCVEIVAIGHRKDIYQRIEGRR